MYTVTATISAEYLAQLITNLSRYGATGVTVSADSDDLPISREHFGY